jgi:hypothetical protein
MIVIILAAVAFAAYQAYQILGPKDWSNSPPDGPSAHVINNSDVDICDDFGASKGQIVTYDRRIKSRDDLYFKVEPGTYILTVYDCEDNLIDQIRDAYIETAYDWEIQ